MLKKFRLKIQPLLPAVATVLLAVFASNAEPNPRTETAANDHFDPVIRNVEGWTVYIDPKMLAGEHAAKEGRALKMPASHLQRIAITIPACITCWKRFGI